jgi:hypothetical protein
MWNINRIRILYSIAELAKTAAYQVEKDSNLRPRCITIEHRFFLFVYADRTQSPVHGLGTPSRVLSPLDESIALVVAI